MREPELSEQERAVERQAHVRALGLSDEIKRLIREEIEDALQAMPACLSAEEQNGYEAACNVIGKRLLAL